MEKTKEFLTISKAVEFIVKNEIKDFYFKKKPVGITLHYFDKDTKCFYCDICGCITPYECEGAEPNVCADCVPEKFNMGEDIYDRNSL